MDMKLKAFEENYPTYMYEKTMFCVIAIPRNLIPRVLQMMHNDLRHFGFKKTFQKIKDKYFWPLNWR